MRIVVPEFPQSSTSRGLDQTVHAVALDGDRRARGGDVDAEVAEQEPGAGDVVTARQADRARAPDGHRREQQRAVRDALVARDAQPSPQGRRSRDRELVGDAHDNDARATW